MNLRSHDLNIPQQLNDAGKAFQQQTKSLSYPNLQNLDENGKSLNVAKQGQWMVPPQPNYNQQMPQPTYNILQNQGYIIQPIAQPNMNFKQPTNISSQQQLQNFDYQNNQPNPLQNQNQNPLPSQHQWSQTAQSPLQYVQTQPFVSPFQQPIQQPIPQIKPPLMPIPVQQVPQSENNQMTNNQKQSKKENQKSNTVDPILSLEEAEKQQEQEMLRQHTQRYLQVQSQKLQSSQILNLYQDPSFLAKLSNHEDVQAILNYCINIKQNLKEILHPRILQQVMEYKKPKPIPFPKESPLKAPKVPFRYQASKIRIRQEDNPLKNIPERQNFYSNRTSFNSSLQSISLKRFGTQNQPSTKYIGREWIRNQLQQSCRYLVRVSLKFAISDRIFENFFQKEYIVQTSQKLKQDCLTEFVNSEHNINRWGLEELMKNSYIELLSDSKDFLAKKAEYELFISNTNYRPTLISSYIYQPGEQEINEMTKSQLEKVSGFLIANDYGSVYFEEPVDLTYTDISTSVHLGKGHFELYPLTLNRSHHLIPYPGAKLNKCCTVTLDIPTEILQLFYDSESEKLDHTKVKNYLASDCLAKGFQMVNYEAEERIFSFRTLQN